MLILLLLLSFVASSLPILLPRHLQCIVVDVALRFGRPEHTTDQLASLLLSKREILSNLTDLIYWLRLDRINADIEHNGFADEREAAITTINDTIIELQTTLNDHKRKLRDLDDNLRHLDYDIESREADASEALSESRLFASIANDIVRQHAQRRAESDIRMKEYQEVLQAFDRASQMDAIGKAMGYIMSLNTSPSIAEYIAAIHGENVTTELQTVRQKIGQKLDLEAALFSQEEIRFNLTITEYRAAIREYRAEYDAIQDEIADLYDEYHQLNEEHEVMQDEADSVEELLQESKATIKAMIRGMLKESLEYTARVKVLNSELDGLNAAALFVNSNMTGDTWPGLCQIGIPGCQRCLYDEQCSSQQLCSEEGQCIDDSVHVE